MDTLDTIGPEFKALREEAAQIEKRRTEIRARVAALKAPVTAAIIEAVHAGRNLNDIAALTGYTAERVRQLARGTDPGVTT